MAVSDGSQTAVVASCELVGVSREIAQRTRAIVSERRDIPADSVCVHCTHTHCGPATKVGVGQGEPDAIYLETLPARIADACLAAVDDLQPGRLSQTVIPCEGIGYNREHDTRPSLEDALSEDWRPAKPELTDTEAHVLRVDGADGMRGFLSYFSCHPVVGSAHQRYISSDFVGVATSMLEVDDPGAVGVFLQGCEGNTNSCVVGHGEQESLLALDAIAARYARQIRPGIAVAAPADACSIAAANSQVTLPYSPLPEAALRESLAEQETILKAAGVTDSAAGVARATVWATAIRKELARLDAGAPIDDTFELWALRIGDIVLVGAPFEIMHVYKRRIAAEFDSPVLVMSLCNGAAGYLPERESFAMDDNYGAQMVPYLVGRPPFSPDVEDVVVDAMVAVVRAVQDEAR
jgi:hypothetical protein